MKQRFKPEASFDLHRRGAEVGSSELSGALSVRSRPARGLMPHCHTQHLHLHLPIHVSGRKRERAKCVHGLNPCPFLKSPPTPPCDFLFHLLDQNRVTWQFLPSRAIENAVFSQVKKMSRLVMKRRRWVYVLRASSTNSPLIWKAQYDRSLSSSQCLQQVLPQT